ncbi:phosphotransferase, partial [Actinomadura sp. 7K507]|uniref:phosphotransferase n=1 Tax=Actinomadura sp. 7K507 TaxID=2530365 RepID=UPI00104D68D6
YDWVRDVDRLHVPDLLNRDGPRLVFTHVRGRHATPTDLPDLARVLARFHSAAHQHLAVAPTSQPHTTARGLTIPGFRERREQRLLDLLAAPTPPDTPLTADDVHTWMEYSDGLPATVYKDANIRNFLLTGTSAPVAVDFDVLTLAPLGYDLAKLVVTAAMTYGALDKLLIAETLDRYNTFLDDTDLPGCTRPQFTAWTQMHHILTSPYLGSNDYQFSWVPTQRAMASFPTSPSWPHS